MNDEPPPLQTIIDILDTQILYNIYIQITPFYTYSIGN